MLLMPMEILLPFLVYFNVRFAISIFQRLKGYRELRTLPIQRYRSLFLWSLPRDQFLITGGKISF